MQWPFQYQPPVCQHPARLMSVAYPFGLEASNIKNSIPSVEALKHHLHQDDIQNVLKTNYRPSLTSYDLFHRFIVSWFIDWCFIQLHHSNLFNGTGTKMTNPEPDTTERSSTQSRRHRRQLQRVVEALTSP